MKINPNKLSQVGAQTTGFAPTVSPPPPPVERIQPPPLPAALPPLGEDPRPPLPPADQVGPPGAGAPPPPADDFPDDTYAAYRKASRAAAKGIVPLAQLWAQLAHADATDRLARELERFNRFVGAYEESEDDEAPPRFADQISYGVADAFVSLATDEELQETLKGAFQGGSDEKASKKTKKKGPEQA